ncbi:cation:proton antiporter [Dongshaea marina]|uniref:cation:proton antiporter n=1 Tax=Dongshaea marina TaxID=2047966 RepID=UPI000D3E8204|nr:cation:proton antiporter [Dongshaea marina]
MEVLAQVLVVLGALLISGLLFELIGRQILLPRVTLLLVFGSVIGPQGFNLIPDVLTVHFELVANVALVMIGFLLGEKLTFRAMHKMGKRVIWISFCAALAPTIIVTCGLLFVGLPVDIAILLGCIASATAPVATVDTVMESGSKGPFADLLLAIVAFDDAWALLFFSFGIAIIGILDGGNGLMFPILHALRDIGGALLLGIAIGAPAAFLTGRLSYGRPMLTEALGVVFLCGGLAIWLDVSFLISAMVMGAVIANFARHHQYPFHAIEGIEGPFMVIFFILAGALFEFESILIAGGVCIVYISCRILGKIVGAAIGSSISEADRVTRRWMGVAMLPQAGAAMGMMLVAIELFPDYRQTLLSVVIGSTVFFEIIGPVFTRLALKLADHSEGDGP